MKITYTIKKEQHKQPLPLRKMFHIRSVLKCTEFVTHFHGLSNPFTTTRFPQTLRGTIPFYQRINCKHMQLATFSLPLTTYSMLFSYGDPV